jgi:hypothetical protein
VVAKPLTPQNSAWLSEACLEDVGGLVGLRLLAYCFQSLWKDKVSMVLQVDNTPLLNKIEVG